MKQRAQPLAYEIDFIDRIVEDYREAVRVAFAAHLTRFPMDLRVYGRIVLEHTHTEGVALTPAQWEVLVPKA